MPDYETPKGDSQVLQRAGKKKQERNKTGMADYETPKGDSQVLQRAGKKKQEREKTTEKEEKEGLSSVSQSN
jgi:hypothetical protein